MKINRRTMLASLAACGSRLLAQEPAKIDPTLYIPKAHRVEDLKLLHEFMDEYAFVDLVTSAPTLRITHIPVILDRTAGTYGKIHGTCLAAESAESGVRRAPDGRHRVPWPARIHLAHVVCEEGSRADVELRGGSRHRAGLRRSLTKTLCTSCSAG